MNRESSIALFRNLENPDTQARFFDRVADDVDWTYLDSTMVMYTMLRNERPEEQRP